MAEVIKAAGDIIYDTGNLVLGIQLKIVSGLFPSKKDDKAPRNLKDRTATVVDAESPYVYIYGRARVGSAIVAVLPSGTRDEYKHIVCIHAAHECDAIEEIYINGKALGTLDGSGNVTTGIFSSSSNVATSNGSSVLSFALSHTPISGTLRAFGYIDNTLTELPYTLAGTTITITSTIAAAPYSANYSYVLNTPYIRVSKHLGASGQVADATLISEIPTKWDATKTLSGMCYTVIRLNLNFQDFQGGCPSIEALIRGKKLHDVRDGSYPSDTPVWSQNPALIIADYLTSEMCNVPRTDLPLADFITAANVCDEAKVHGDNYQANGIVTSEDDQKDVLNQIAQSMAGSIVSTTWGVMAGKYVAPVMSLLQSDIVGDMSYTSGVSEGDLFNGIKGQYISSVNLYVPTDFAPYQNSTYVTADGLELWSDIDFMWTDDKQRVHNLARILTEDQRNGFTITADFSYKAWALQIGQRVTFTSAFLGQTSKVYRIINKTFAPDSAVTLTIKEDASTIWDLADTVTLDDTPNTDLPNPFYVPPPSNIVVTEELYETTGSGGVKVKAILTWTAPADVNVQDYEIMYKGYSEATYTLKYFSINETVEILDIADGVYDFKIRARNHLNLRSDWSLVKTATIYGLITAPSNVLNFTVTPFNAMALCKWDRTVDLDVKIGGDIEIRFVPLTTGATYAESIIVPDGKLNGDATSAIVSLAEGTYYAKFKDSTNHFSETPASFVVTEALISGWTTIQTSTQHPTFSGAKTDLVVIDSNLKLDTTTLIDSLGMIDDLGFIDSIGTLSSIGTYEFNATMDLTTSITRRFHSHIKALAYNANDIFDDRTDLMDSWADFDGATINDCTATTYASISDDNITYTSFAPFMVADFKCRYAKFKTVLISGDATHNIQISELSVAAKVPT
jgi:hypothetical protein